MHFYINKMPNLQTLPFSYFCFVGKPGINLEFDFRGNYIKRHNSLIITQIHTKSKTISTQLKHMSKQK